MDDKECCENCVNVEYLSGIKQKFWCGIFSEYFFFSLMDRLCCQHYQRRKKKVKKVIEGWVNIYGFGYDQGGLYHTKEEATKERCVGFLGEPLFIRHE